ncbi:sensor histidine kinase [Parasphingorhabdus sp.]|uniref:sensor histidine kinase n=1 Tax=Parasphingorhabdus sp. TaxID=2709688 RepID=UPI003D2A4A8C
MTERGDLAEPVRGRIDANGLLVEADAILLRLQLNCGGQESGPLAVPQLADLCRLSQRLGMNLSRPVQAAYDDYTIDMWAETRIDLDDENRAIRLVIKDWSEYPTAAMDRVEDARERDFDQLKGRGSIRTDSALRVVSMRLPGALPGGESEIGQALLDIFDVIPPSGHSKLLEAVAERQPIRGQRVRQKHQDQYLFHLEGQPLIDNLGHFSGYRFMVERDDQDVDNPALEEMEPGKLISQNLFGSQLGPALRQPLGKIIANAETIGSKLEGPLRGDYASYAKDIASAGRHLLDLVNDLSDLEAIQRPGFSVAEDDIDLVDLAHRSAGLLAVKAADHQMRIDVPDKELEQPAQGEFRRTLQILVNLIGNAIRYSPDGSVIKIRTTEKDGQAAITVSDQGDGIAVEDQDRIFEKFERLGRSGDGGSGLGLFISRRLANAMGGSLTVASSPGQGATFTLTLPARDQD